ncbi:hypothetical protein BV898_13025 [Hypsibius exemplaris]|uniref:G-protein coupled receptors family 1 profile domain-containing protein n=1 Tax=Hypsibius exemplaris TaxID=2072580 RepID=A0A1W0WBW9_HYPEX|nr:hypothetical protein BV898_13025 [Hypsibius exemplaris]
MALLPLGYCASLAEGIFGLFLTSMRFYVPYAITGGAAVLLLWQTRRGRPRAMNQTEDDRRRQQVVLRRIRMARMMLLIFLWAGLCNIPGNVTAVGFPRLFSQNPVSALWMRTCLVCQYAFTPFILFLCNAEYRKRLGYIFRGGRVTPDDYVEARPNAISNRTDRANLKTVSYSVRDKSLHFDV